MRILMRRRMTGLPTDRRQGYTLVELMITMALIMLIMAILSTSFVVGLDTFSKLKALGDMSERLRAAVSVLRRDLDADHFEGRIRPSDPGVFTDPPNLLNRPREGFFRVRQYVGGSTNEGTGAEGVASSRATRDALHMTVKLRGNRPEDFFSAKVPGNSELLKLTTTFFDQPLDARHQEPGSGVYRSQWAEVAYYMKVLDPDPKNWSANGTPLYALYRQLRVAVVNNKNVNTSHKISSADTAAYAHVSRHVKSGYLHFNSPRDLTEPSKRSLPLNSEGTLLGGSNVSIDNILLTDVVSFDIKVLRYAPPPTGNQPPAPFGYPLGVRQFEDITDWDSGNPNASKFPIMAIQITLRVWDLKTQQTRQVTLIQDL